MPDFIISKIIETIVSGNVDASLDAITNAVKMRRQNLNDRKILYISPGDIVEFNSQASPKYLRGQKATVTKVNEKTVIVSISEDAWGARRYRGMKNIRTPIAIVDKAVD